MAQAEIHTYGDTELVAELARHRKELFELRFKHATGSLENTSKLRLEKKQIARILTELRVREIAAAEVASNQEANQ